MEQQTTGGEKGDPREDSPKDAGTSKEVAVTDPPGTIGRVVKLDNAVEQVLIQGNLAQLQPEQRVQYYNATCKSLGLNPLTKPFDYINLNGKLTLYAKRDATDQLRRTFGVSIKIVDRTTEYAVHTVTAQATTKDGRTDEATGSVSLANLKGDALANALMKAETKAKRRVTLSICGLGFLDETEIETIPGVGQPAQAQPRQQQGQPRQQNAPQGRQRAPQQGQRTQGGGQGRGKAQKLVTEPQRKRLYAITQEYGWSEDEVKDLIARYGKESSKELTMEEYDQVVETIQAGGAPVEAEYDERGTEGAMGQDDDGAFANFSGGAGGF